MVEEIVERCFTLIVIGCAGGEGGDEIGVE